jgi:sarcosine/dimethylglycine N-methyltransferase
MAASNRVQDHYASTDIATRVLATLRETQGDDAPITPDALAPLDHFHGRGLVATRELAALLGPRSGDRILDIGSGIGGPARWIASHFGCHVTGVDLTPEFCRAAEALNVATGMGDRVRILEGSALALPAEDVSFDRAYSQNVVMNIADKAGFYREAFRVLKPRGVLALTNVGAGPAGMPYFPVPWAAGPDTSFLSTPEETQHGLAAAGFEIVSFNDVTAATLPAQRELLRRLEAEGLPPLGWHVFMGVERSRVLQANGVRSHVDGRLTFMEILVRRPA